jgi:hypothetical protein
MKKANRNQLEKVEVKAGINKEYYVLNPNKAI